MLRTAAVLPSITLGSWDWKGWVLPSVYSAQSNPKILRPELPPPIEPFYWINLLMSLWYTELQLSTECHQGKGKLLWTAELKHKVKFHFKIKPEEEHPLVVLPRIQETLGLIPSTALNLE